MSCLIYCSSIILGNEIQSDHTSHHAARFFVRNILKGKRNSIQSHRVTPQDFLYAIYIPNPPGGGSSRCGRGVVYQEGSEPVLQLDQSVALFVGVGLGGVHVRAELDLRLVWKYHAARTGTQRQGARGTRRQGGKETPDNELVSFQSLIYLYEVCITYLPGTSMINMKRKLDFEVRVLKKWPFSWYPYILSTSSNTLTW